MPHDRYRREARREKKEARREARGEKKVLRRETREAKKETRREKREELKEVRRSDLPHAEKRELKREIRRDAAERIRDIRTEKKERKAEIREDRARALAEADPFRWSDAQKHEVNIRTRRVLEFYGDDRNGTWFSYLHIHQIAPSEILHPQTLQELKDLVRRAAAKGAHVRAVGSGHSFSDIYRTDGILVDTHRLDRVLPLDALRLRDSLADHDGNPVERRHLFQIEAGMRIQKLNEELDRRDLGVLNMGSYDGQTFAGAASTSTHGTGIGLPPIPDMILSLVLVTARGEALRIEPTNGISDARAWREDGIERLIQDDDTFYSVTVSMGCMGILYSAVIQVRDAYWLEERKERMDWDDLRERLREQGGYGGGILDHRHFDVLINPYVSHMSTGHDRGRRQCLLTWRDFTDRKRHYAHETRGVRGAERWKARDVKFMDPEGTARTINTAFRLMGKHYINVGHRVFIVGADEVGGYACEWGFPMNRYLDAVDVILGVIDQAVHEGAQVATSPFSLRFVRAAKAYLSPQHGRDTCMIEMPMLYGTPGRPDEYALMHRYYDALIRLRGRPHWGLEFSDLTNEGGLLEQLYERFRIWRDVRRRLASGGMFDNVFTDRLGISTG